MPVIKKSGLITRIYVDQVRNGKRRGHGVPTYSKQELTDWLFSQKKFHVLYDNWKRLDYQSEYKPSIDRKDDYIGYTMDNIQIMTWGENRAKGHSDMRNGINNKQSSTILQYSLDGTFIQEHYSISSAARLLGVKRKNISNCLNRMSKHSGGFLWEYKNEKDPFCQ